MNAPNRKETDLVFLSDEAAVKKILADSIYGLWGIVNNLTRLRPSRREFFRVSLFGSSRTQPETFAYKEAKKIAKALAMMGCEVMTGGGPGLMQAANEGAREAGASDKIHSIGLSIQLPFEQSVNPFVNEVYEHGTFFTRLHHFVLASDAFVVLPGGIGTTLEAMMIWQLLQVRHINGTPLIFAGQMWEGFLDWARNTFLDPEKDLASPEDFTIPVVAHTSEEVIAIVSQRFEEWSKKG